MVLAVATESLLAGGLLAVHVLAGLLALAAGAAAFATRKGGPRHRRAGRAYVVAMAIVVVTAVPLAVRIESWFLLAVAAFSGYLVVAGYRAVARRRSGRTAPGRSDYAAHGSMVVVGSLMVGVGGWRTVAGPVGLAPVLVAFGAIGLAFAGRALWQFRRAPTAGSPPLSSHVWLMGGAYIATVTAAATVNLAMLPPLVRWLGPTAVGVPLIASAARRAERQFGQ